MSLTKNDVVLDTSSINRILKNQDLLEIFFEKLNTMNSKAVVPFTSFSELSVDSDIRRQFHNLYKKKELRIIRESLNERIKREIDSPIISNLYFNKSVDISKIDHNCYKDNKKDNEYYKRKWEQNCQEKRKQFLIDFNKTPQERNQIINETLKDCQFLTDYMNSKDYWVLVFFEKNFQNFNIEFLKNQIYSNRNRYKQINLLQCLMRINMQKSIHSHLANRGDLFDMDIASFSAYSYGFISEDEGLTCSLQKIKDRSDILSFENNYKIYYKIESFIEQ